MHKHYLFFTAAVARTAHSAVRTTTAARGFSRGLIFFHVSYYEHNHKHKRSQNYNCSDVFQKKIHDKNLLTIC